jgi:hypothetical protein
MYELVLVQRGSPELSSYVLFVCIIVRDRYDRLNFSNSDRIRFVDQLGPGTTNPLSERVAERLAVLQHHIQLDNVIPITTVL